MVKSYSSEDPELAYEVEACTNYPIVKAKLAQCREALEKAAYKMENCVEDLYAMKDAEFPPEDFHRIYDWHHDNLCEASKQARFALAQEKQND